MREEISKSIMGCYNELAAMIVEQAIHDVVQWKVLEARYPMIDGKVPDTYLYKGIRPGTRKCAYLRLQKEGKDAWRFLHDESRVTQFVSLSSTDIDRLVDAMVAERTQNIRKNAPAVQSAVFAAAM